VNEVPAALQSRRRPNAVTPNKKAGNPAFLIFNIRMRLLLHSKFNVRVVSVNLYGAAACQYIGDRVHVGNAFPVDLGYYIAFNELS
jgi:hypothetical protein